MGEEKVNEYSGVYDSLTCTKQVTGREEMGGFDSFTYSEVIKGDYMEKCVANRIVGFEFIW